MKKLFSIIILLSILFYFYSPLFGQATRGGQYLGFTSGAPEMINLLELAPPEKMQNVSPNNKPYNNNTTNQYSANYNVNTAKELKKTWMSYANYPTTIPNGFYNISFTNSVDFNGYARVFVENNLITEFYYNGNALAIQKTFTITNGTSSLKFYSSDDIFDIFFIEYLNSFNTNQNSGTYSPTNTPIKTNSRLTWGSHLIENR